MSPMYCTIFQLIRLNWTLDYKIKNFHLQILAIYDDLPPSKNGSANEVESAQTLSIPVTVNRHGINTQFVEVRNLERPPGLPSPDLECLNFVCRYFPVTGLQVQRENAQENRRQNLQKTQNPNLPVAEEVAHVHFSQPGDSKKPHHHNPFSFHR
jgi:hypothetical protein